MEENNRKYICSRGILKSCDIHSNNPISSVQQLRGYDFSQCKNGSTVYVCGSAVTHFISEILPRLLFKIVLVTGDCDETCWTDFFPGEQTCWTDVFPGEHLFKSFIESNKIIHWFSQNCTWDHPKLTRIPIGLDYHTMTNHHAKWGPKLTPIEQENMLLSIINNTDTKLFWKRKLKCYSNFHFSMKTKYGYDRIDAFKNIPGNLVDYEQTHASRERVWINQSKYSFVISPHGNGLDCHRTWEALVLGCIPIVKTSGLDPLYIGLPVLIVDNWSDINEQLLQTTVAEFKNKKFDYDRLLLSYWVDMINSKK